METRRSRRASVELWIKWRAVDAGLAALFGFSIFALAGSMLLAAPAREATELSASAAEIAIRSDHDTVPHGLLDCVDPGHCGGIIGSTGETVGGDIAASTFALSWASDWNRWAEAHWVPQQILAVGCHYLPMEHFYLCAVRVSVDRASAPEAGCGLVVVSAEGQLGPNDRIVNGLKTTCHIFSTYPRQRVSLQRSRSPRWLEIPRRAAQRTRR